MMICNHVFNPSTARCNLCFAKLLGNDWGLPCSPEAAMNEDLLDGESRHREWLAELPKRYKPWTEQQIQSASDFYGKRVGPQDVVASEG